MSDKVKNTITNILGLIMSCVAVYGLVWLKLSLMSFLGLSFLGLGLFLFKARQTKKWINKLWGRFQKK